MLIRSICTLALLTGLASCGGEEPSNNGEQTTYTDAAMAVDAGASAYNSANYGESANAYGYAAENAPSDKYKIQYTIEMAKAHSKNNNADAAITALQEMASAHGEQLDAATLQGLADWGVNESALDIAELAVAIASDVLPADSGFDTETVVAAIAAKKTGDNAALAALGYVGD